jgi:hypothetical protein
VTPNQPQAKPRSRKIYILWAIALTLLLTLGAFCWLVVVPVWRVRSVLGSMPVKDCGSLIERLGGDVPAMKTLEGYIRRPNWLAPDKLKALALMNCLSGGRALLSGAPADESLPLEARFAVLEFLATEQDNDMDEGEWREKALLEACDVPDRRVRERAARMLHKWRTKFNPPPKKVKRFKGNSSEGMERK